MGAVVVGEGSGQIGLGLLQDMIFQRIEGFVVERVDLVGPVGQRRELAEVANRQRANPILELILMFLIQLIGAFPHPEDLCSLPHDATKTQPLFSG